MPGRFFRRAGAGVPRMTVRRHVAWPARAGLLVVLLAAALATGIWVGRSDLPWFGLEQRRAESQRLQAENSALRDERDRLRDAPPVVDSSAVMEASTVHSLGEQIARLEADNARLKEDVAFFEAATADRQPRATASSEVAIRRLQVVQDRNAHAARYRILLTQDSRATRDFAGDLELAVTLQRNGKAVTIGLPLAASAKGSTDLVQMDGDERQFRLAFRSYKRIDGSFRIPTDATVSALQVRIVSRGAVLAQQTVPVV